METIVVDDVFKLLQCTEAGLDDTEASRRIELFGPNKLESDEQNPFLQVCGHTSFRDCAALTFFRAVPRFYVEPTFVGYGGSCTRRYRRF